MNVRKFIAANASDALKNVKETLGNDAIILSNRGVPGGVEIMAVAARDMAMIVPTPVIETPRPAPLPQPTLGDDEDYRVSLNSARAQAATPRPAPVDRPRTTISSPSQGAMRVNAGIPKVGALRNLEPARAQVPLSGASAGL